MWSMTNDTNPLSMDNQVGGLSYLLAYLPIYLPYSIILFFGICIGLAGNLLIITSVLIHKDLRRNSTCLLIANLAFSDLVITMFVNIWTLVGVFEGKYFFDMHKWICVSIAAICLIACATSLLIMGFLAINRYICIFYPNSFPKLFSVKSTLLYCALAWVIGVMVDLPNFFGIGDHVYDAKTLACIFDRLKVPYTMAFSIGCIIIPCACIGFLYVSIFYHAYRIRSRVMNERMSNRNHIEAIKIAKSLFASFFIFAICWIPVSIVLIVGKEDQLPMEVHTFTNLPAHMNSAINPIFYGLFNPKIREGYRNLLRVLTLKRFFHSKINPTNTTSVNKKHKSLKKSTIPPTVSFKHQIEMKF